MLVLYGEKMERGNIAVSNTSTSPTVGTQAGQTPALTGNESKSAGEEKKRIATSPEALIFYTNTDESNYPIYLSEDREVFIKRRPKESRIVATFVLKSVSELNAELSHQLFSVAIEALKEITKSEPEKILKFELQYEAYRGDMETFIGEAKAYCIKLISKETTFSGLKHERSKAWAVGFDWARRISAKYPALNGYCYVKGEEGNKGRAYVHVTVKLPIPTPEFTRLFNEALTTTTTITTTTIKKEVSMEKDIDKQIEEIKEELRKLELRKQELIEKLRELEKQKMIPGRIASVVQNIPTTQIQTEVRKRRIACPTCDGSGQIADSPVFKGRLHYITCPRCKGSGWIEVNEQ